MARPRALSIQRRAKIRQLHGDGVKLIAIAAETRCAVATVCYHTADLPRRARTSLRPVLRRILEEAAGALVRYSDAIARLYGGAPPASARAIIRSMVQRLKQREHMPIETVPGCGYRLVCVGSGARR